MFKEFSNPEEQDYDITSSLKANEEEPVVPVVEENLDTLPDDIPEDIDENIDEEFMPEEEIIEDIPEDIDENLVQENVDEIEMPNLRHGR